MKRIIVGALLALPLAVGSVGCASSTELENEARIHTLRADAAAKDRDFGKAQKEQEKAQSLHTEAIEKAAKEGRTDVTVPADVPTTQTR
jgi:hypothetical protein